MQSKIQRFIENADQFVALWHGVEKINLDLSQLPTDRQRESAQVNDLHDSINAMIREAIKIRPLLSVDGQSIASFMEFSGDDSAGLITFLNHVGSGASMEPARILWPSLRVKLQQLALKASMPTAEQPSQILDIDRKVAAKLSTKDLATKHGIKHSSLRGRLDRWRHEHDAGYVEVSNPAKNEPQFLYDESAVMPVIEAMKAKSLGQKRAANVHQKKN